MNNQIRRFIKELTNVTTWLRIFLLLSITFSCVGCDQLTKAAAKSYLSRTEGLSFAGDTLRLQYAENKGAFLSLGSSLPERWRMLVFIGIVGIFLTLLLSYLLIVSSISPVSVVSLSLIFGGGSSNLIDRIAYDGYVVDFINIGIGSLRTGIFNVADVAITSGLLLLLCSNLRQRRQRWR